MIWHVQQNVVKCFIIPLPRFSYIYWLIHFKRKGSDLSSRRKLKKIVLIFVSIISLGLNVWNCFSADILVNHQFLQHLFTTIATVNYNQLPISWTFVQVVEEELITRHMKTIVEVKQVLVLFFFTIQSYVYQLTQKYELFNNSII